jgi:O-antigen/teichoic acid export membrane protein
MSIPKLAKQTALYGLSSIFGRLITFVFLTPYLSYNFVPEEMGMQTELYAWAAFINVVLTFRMETAFFRYGSEAEQRSQTFSTAQWSILGLSTVWILFLSLGASSLAPALGYAQHPEYLQYIAWITALDALSALPFALLRMEGKAGLFAGLRLANLALHLGSLFFFLELCPRYFPSIYDETIGIGYVFWANLLASAATLVLLLPQTRGIWRRYYDRGLMQNLWQYASPLLMASFAGIINEVLDRSLLRWLLEGTPTERLAQVGIYGACYKISIFMNLFTQAFQYAAEPFFFKHAQANGERKVYAEVAFLFSLLASGAFLAIMVWMDVLQYFVGSAYREGLLVVPILLLANWCLGLYYIVATWYKLSDQTQYGARIALIGAGITIVTNIILIPYLGYVGAAWATLLCYASMLVLAYRWGQVYYPVPYPVVQMGAYLGLALAFWSAFMLLTPYLPWPSLRLVLGTTFLLAYVYVVYDQEGEAIRVMIKRR